MTPEIVITRLTGFGRGKTHKINSAAASLGTDAACDVRFDATWDKQVSPRHLRLEFVRDRLWLEDMSETGTFVAGQKVTRMPLESGAELELGQGGPKIRLEYVAPVNVSASTRVAPAAVAAAPTTRAAAETESAPQPQMRVAAAAVVMEEAPRPLPPPLRRGPPKWLAPLAVVVALAAGVAAFFYFRSPANDQALADMAKEYSNAVGLVVIVHPGLEGGKPTPMATAWAVGPRVFATNSHVSKPVRDVLAKGGSAFIVINRNADRKLRITRAVVHPRYDKPERNFEGKEVAVPAYDVGLLHVDEDAPKVFKVAPRAELEKLDSGYRIGYLGFPMEGMAGGGVEMRSPVATMQAGIITATTDYWLAQAPFEKRLLVQHSLGAAGGASGSPIFNARGEVIAILNAGNIIGVVSFETGKVTRAPSGVMVNFAQRVDVLRDIWPEYPQ